jgi:hypothetical protein
VSPTAKNIIAAVAALLLAVSAAALSACRTTHLGPNHGRLYHEAFDRQASGEDADHPPALTAEDAKQVLHVHAHGKDGKDGKNGSNGASGSGLAAPAMNTDSISSGSWPGAGGNITLDAK